MKDLFSKQSRSYARYRPGYPKELFEYIIQFVRNRDTAWDCATGNGQAATGLAPYFKKVIATDTSEKQLELAPTVNNIQYLVSPAESTPFEDNSFDLITVAQAYHWLQFDAFEKEVKRVARKDAVIAIWGYRLFTTGDNAVDDLVRMFYSEVVGPYWDKERKYVDECYTTVPFNFEPLPSGHFTINATWNIEEVTGYLNSWSSVQHYINARGSDPVEMIRGELERLWKGTMTISFPIFHRLGKT